MRRRVRWAVGMTIFGIVVAASVGALTGSVGWALVGLLGSSVVANMFARPAHR